ncbi:MAG: class II fructose-bisphosphate aldolase [Chloroflexi bacterium]|nr:class II fructose-bisphosphate aldolase [Chloroflexota bacterium]MDA1001933.1 class II fructose-bisphosphate aldolase [Chloroflexota bacterium]
MPLANGRELLAAAERGRYAVPGFNVSNLEIAQGVIDAAEAKRAPIFLQFNPANLRHFGGIEVAAALGRLVATRARVPVALHLDHGPDIATLRAATGCGFTSLMFDGSTFPLERNLRETREAYIVALSADVALEAELGHVGGREPGVVTSEAVLTEPEAARRFVDETRVDSLAVSVGTAHGLAGDVNIALIQELRVATSGRPLVLHGGSGVSPRQMRQAVSAGIRKVNISTEIHAAFARALQSASGNDPRPALRAGREAVAQAASDRIDLLGAALRA